MGGLKWSKFFRSAVELSCRNVLKGKYLIRCVSLGEKWSSKEYFPYETSVRNSEAQPLLSCTAAYQLPLTFGTPMALFNQQVFTP